MTTTLNALEALEKAVREYHATLVGNGFSGRAASLAAVILGVDTLRAALTDKAGAEKPSDIFDWLETEVSAIDPVYRGDPRHDHDAWWMRDEVAKLIAHARKAFPDTTSPLSDTGGGEPTRDEQNDIDNGLLTHDKAVWSDWIPWSGGECPIPWAKAGDFETQSVDGENYGLEWPAFTLVWSHDDEDGADFITDYRYRLDRAPDGFVVGGG